MKKTTHHKGFIILFTILIASIIMVIGLGIYSIATRETVLSGTAREAQYSFYAADAGVECALYAQFLDNTTTIGTYYPLTSGATGNPFDCGPGNQPVITSQNGQYVFDVFVDPVRKTCAHVNIYNITAAGGYSARRVIAQGYNICNSRDAKPITTNPLLVERDLDTTYILNAVPPAPPVGP
jgi:hypothetical protein